MGGYGGDLQVTHYPVKFRCVSDASRGPYDGNRNPRLGKEARWALIRKVGNAPSYMDAGWLLRKLADLNGLKPHEVETILQLASANDQAHHAYVAAQPLRELINRHKRRIRKPMLRRFLDVWVYEL